MRRICIIVSLTFLCCVSSLAQDIYEVDATETNYFKVTLNSNDKELWIGCSVRYRNDVVVDFKVQKTDRSSNNQFFYFYPKNAYLPKKSLKNLTRTSKLNGYSPLEATFALWGKKISKSECKKINRGNPCEYCKKYGFHLDRLVERCRVYYGNKKKC